MTSLVLYVIISLLIGHTLTGLFQKEIKHAGGSGGGRERGAEGKTFLKNPWVSYTLPLGRFQAKQNFTPVLGTLKIPRPNTKIYTPGNSTLIFWSPLQATWHSSCHFFNTLGLEFPYH